MLGRSYIDTGSDLVVRPGHVQVRLNSLRVSSVEAWETEIREVKVKSGLLVTSVVKKFGHNEAISLGLCSEEGVGG